MSISPSISPTVSPKEYFAAELRKYRKQAGLSQKELADLIGWSTSLVSMVELGHRKAPREMAQKIDEVLELGSALTDLWDLLNHVGSHLPDWFRSWIEIEREAEFFRTWHPLVVPGLLQTRDYAEAMLRGEPRITAEQLEEYVSARMDRQTILNRPTPPMLWAVIDEGVLLRPIGEDGVMAAQLRHLVEMGERPDIAIQILPLEARTTTGINGGFVIAQAHRGVLNAAYVESASAGQVTDRPDEVAALALRYEAIRVEALSQRESLKLIKETIKQWT
ncbi:helix-turn-helix domain-containing protein [Streptosporangium amethystogenes]|uniref:helix-turn-helix domain-containing protein n=1 Tax=Streptosporangium amethystogenes TaxID=2002 RepID=UPI0004C54C6B|nr:helix-turn-helix transcriptional regulator [Streptosporangium amethystogenes]